MTRIRFLERLRKFALRFELKGAAHRGFSLASAHGFFPFAR
jgi:hypothetical protein